MGCDIHSFVEVLVESQGWTCCPSWHPFSDRSYGIFGFLADVRNYSHIPPISQGRGLPSNLSKVVQEEYNEWSTDAHTPSHLTLDELLSFNYDQQFWDRRVTRQIGPNAWTGAAIAHGGDEPGKEEGEHVTIRKFLGTEFFTTLEMLKHLGPPTQTRIVFWFDN